MKRQILLSLCLLTIYCVAPVFAQENSANKEKLIAEFVKLKKTLVPYAENQCEAYGKNDFIGSEINLSVKDADIRDVLKYVTEDFGCTFVFDSSVGKTSITVNICNVPWNIALDSVLKSENLAIENRNSILRVINSEYTYETNWSGSSLSKEPLYTGFVKLKNLKLNWQMPPCFGRSMSDFDLDEFKNSKKF